VTKSGKLNNDKFKLMLYVHNTDCQQLITGQIVNSSLFITGQFQMLIIKEVAKTFVL